MRPIVYPLIAALACAAAPAAAADPAFVGSHVALLAGWDQTDVGPNLPAHEGLVYGLAGGHDWLAGPLRIGIEGEFTGSTVEGDVAGGTQRIGRSFYAGTKLGLPFTRSLLLYATGGYANGRFAGPVSYTGDGWRTGGGGELALTGKLFARAEFRYADYGRIARGQQVVAMLGLRF